MKKNLRIVALILALVLCLGLMSGCGSKTVKIDMEPYIIASYTGFSGNATAHFDIDLSGFESEAMSKWKDDGQYWSKLGDLAALELTFSFNPTTAENLKNGDKITVTMSYDEDVAKSCGYTLTGTTKTFTVEGIEDAIMIDPFDEEFFGIGDDGIGKLVHVVMDGPSPDIWAHVQYNAGWYDMWIYEIKYNIEDNWGIQNGDVVTITASISDTYTKQGYALSRTEMSFVVEGY